MSDESTGNLPVAVTKAYDVLLWLINHVAKFPKFHRCMFGHHPLVLSLVEA